METSNTSAVQNYVPQSSQLSGFMQAPDAAARPSLVSHVTIKTESVARVAGGVAACSTTVATPLNSSLPPSSVQNVSMSSVKSATVGSSAETKLLDKRRITDLLKEVDPLEQLDEDVEDLLAQIADDFIDNVVTSACQLAKHRKSGTVEVKDIQLHLERHWNMWIPGFGSEELRPYKKQATTEAHRQRMALIKKTLKKS